VRWKRSSGTHVHHVRRRVFRRHAWLQPLMRIQYVRVHDACGRAQGDSPNVLRDDQPADWNGETGNHLTCEEATK